MEDLFAEWLDPAQKLAIEREFLALEKRQQDNPWMLWRIEVNMALADEGINISWPELEPEDEDEMYRLYVVVQPIVSDKDIKDSEKIPFMHLKDLYEQEDGVAPNPRAVAAYIKAVLYDKRFRLWQYEEG